MSAQLNDLMMNHPLTLTHFFERSRRLFAKKTLATRVPGRPLFRYTYAEFAEHTMRLAGLLRDLGVKKGDRVATLAWNSHRHLEAYWAVPLSDIPDRLQPVSSFAPCPLEWNDGWKPTALSDQDIAYISSKTFGAAQPAKPETKPDDRSVLGGAVADTLGISGRPGAVPTSASRWSG